MDGVLQLPSEGVFFVLAAAFVRVGATLQSMVIFSTGAVPVQVRVGLAGTMALLVAGVVDPPTEVAWDAATLAVALGGEVLLGLFLGTATRLLFSFIELAGTLVGLNAGLAVASQFDPMTMSQGLVATRLIQAVGMLALLAADGHHAILGGVLDTFAVAPPGSGIPSAAGALTASDLFGTLFLDAVTITMPVVAAVLFINVVAALVTRFSQQMNIYFSVGLAMAVIAGLWASIPVIGDVVDLVHWAITRVDGIFFAIAGA